MLLVILGAGASYDSLPPDVLEQLTLGTIADFRPPLAQELFDDRASFGEALDKYPQCAALVGELRKRLRADALLEQELERYQEQASDDPLLYRQLVAIRFYLQEVLWTCGSRWRELSHGVTNYTDLLFRLARWRHEREEALCVVTFNYDLLLDEAAVGTLGADLSTVEAYAADDRYRFLKLHGSVNWGRRVRSPGGAHYSKPGHARRVLIDSANSLDVTDDYVVRTPDQSPSDSAPYASILLPAIAIPVETKSEFECPRSHLEALDLCVEQTMKILVIGWRGTENHFLSRLKALPGIAPFVAIVGASEEGTQETASNLASFGLSEDRIQRFTRGFSNYLKTDLLEEFLNL